MKKEIQKADLVANTNLNEITYKELTEEDLNLTHTFSDGIYCRSGVIPKGSLAIGHKHINKCINIMSTGKMKMLMDGEYYELTAPCIFESAAGSRKIVYILEDVTLTNVHATTTTDMDELRKEIVGEEDFLITDETRGVLCG